MKKERIDMNPDKFIIPESYWLDMLMRHIVDVAKKSTCSRSKCGAVIFKSVNDIEQGGDILGEGYNSPPGTCHINSNIVTCIKDTLPQHFKSDKTCCMHAEQRAIMHALKRYGNLQDTYLFFIRLNENNEPKQSGEPYCTICSKMALDAGIKYFCLWHEEGWTAYNTNYYNELSFKYK